MLIAVARYRTITGDATSTDAAVTAAIEEATGLLTDALRRPLEQAERTEVCTFYPDGTIYPIVTPVISVTGGYTVVDDVVYGAVPDNSPVGLVGAADPPTITLTYVGGFDPDEDDPDAVDHLPAYIAHDLAWAAWRILHPQAPPPADATSVSLGDASVTYANPTGGGTTIGFSNRTMRWRTRSLP